MPDQTSPHTHQLVDFAARLSFADLPAEVVHETRRCVLDFLGVAIGAADYEAPRIALDTIRELGGAHQATVLAYGERTSVAQAALTNGILSHVLDFDDTHSPTVLHPSGPVLAAGVPIAEWQGRGGRDLIAAFVAAFEVEARASLALYPEHYDRGWHMTGTTGTLGAAVSAGRLLGLDTPAMLNAVGLAATQASGHREQFGAMAKSFHSGKAASNGVLGALFARRGYTAAADSLEGRRGMFHVMSTRADAAELTNGLGTQWEIFRNGFKPYSCGVVIHPCIDAVRQLGVAGEDVERIELRVHPLVLELTGKTDPQTGLEGKFSVMFACAIALLEGTARHRQFTDENVRRADVIALRDRIVPVADEAIAHTEAVAIAELRDGRTVRRHVTDATGTPANPISDAELRDKFLDLSEPVLGTDRAAQLADLVSRLETLDTLDELLRLAVRE